MMNAKKHGRHLIYLNACSSLADEGWPGSRAPTSESPTAGVAMADSAVTYSGQSDRGKSRAAGRDRCSCSGHAGVGQRLLESVRGAIGPNRTVDAVHDMPDSDAEHAFLSTAPGWRRGMRSTRKEGGTRRRKKGLERVDRVSRDRPPAAVPVEVVFAPRLQVGAARLFPRLGPRARGRSPLQPSTPRPATLLAHISITANPVTRDDL